MLVDVRVLITELVARRRGLTRGGAGGRANERPIPWSDGADRVLADVEQRVRASLHAPAGTTAMHAADGALAAWRTSGDGPAWVGLHEAVRRAEDYLAPPARWYAGICSAAPEHDDGQACSRDLYARGTTGTVRCPACGAEHDVAARRAVLVDRIDDQLVTLREFVTAAPSLLGTDVRLDRVQSLVRRGKVTKRGTRTRLLGDGTLTGTYTREVDVYRFGDLRDACATRLRATVGTNA